MLQNKTLHLTWSPLVQTWAMDSENTGVLCNYPSLFFSREGWHLVAQTQLTSMSWLSLWTKQHLVPSNSANFKISIPYRTSPSLPTLLWLHLLLGERIVGGRCLVNSTQSDNQATKTRPFRTAVPISPHFIPLGRGTPFSGFLRFLSPCLLSLCEYPVSKLQLQALYFWQHWPISGGENSSCGFTPIWCWEF